MVISFVSGETGSGMKFPKDKNGRESKTEKMGVHVFIACVFLDPWVEIGHTQGKGQDRMKKVGFSGEKIPIIPFQGNHFSRKAF